MIYLSLIVTQLDSNNWYQSASLIAEGLLCDCVVTFSPGNHIYLVEIVDICEGHYQVVECRTHQE